MLNLHVIYVCLFIWCSSWKWSGGVWRWRYRGSRYRESRGAFPVHNIVGLYNQWSLQARLLPEISSGSWFLQIRAPFQCLPVLLQLSPSTSYLATPLYIYIARMIKNCIRTWSYRTWKIKLHSNAKTVCTWSLYKFIVPYMVFDFLQNEIKSYGFKFCASFTSSIIFIQSKNHFTFYFRYVFSTILNLWHEPKKKKKKVKQANIYIISNITRSIEVYFFFQNNYNCSRKIVIDRKW